MNIFYDTKQAVLIVDHTEEDHGFLIYEHAGVWYLQTPCVR